MSRQFTIRAKTLDLAMKRAKERFGPAAVIFDTRTVKRKDRFGMAIEPVVELVVAPGSGMRPEVIQQLAGDPDLREGDARADDPPNRVRKEVERIERLIRSIDNAQAKLRSFDTGYPLNEALISSGVSDGSLRVLQNSYEERVPSALRAGAEAAKLHLLDYLKCSKASSFADISGPHVFLGSAGSGKTSLVIKLAAELVREGRTVAVIVAVPYHSGEVHRIEEAAATLMIDAAVAENHAELARMVTLYADRDVVLVDTPCMLSRRSPAATAMFEQLRSSNSMFRHMVCSLTHDNDFLLSELDLYRAWDCDFLSISKVDLARKCGKILEIALNREVTFSFVSYEEDVGPGIRLATPALLLSLVSPEMADTARKGSR